VSENGSETDVMKRDMRVRWGVVTV
jgi:hypothetical protein